MAFHEILFPLSISLGSSAVIERRTSVTALASGFERRNARWAHGRRSYDAGFGLRGLDDIETLIAFFEARMGRLYGFRWRDWADWKSCAPSAEPGPGDCLIGLGDGVQTDFQLMKTYVSGAQSYRRPIRKPVGESLRVAVDGIELAQDEATLDETTGLVTLASAPAEEARVTAGFTFDVPVRFDTDRLEINLAAFEAGETPSAPVMEVRC